MIKGGESSIEMPEVWGNWDYKWSVFSDLEMEPFRFEL